VPEEVKQAMELVFVKHIDEVLDNALLSAAPKPGPVQALGFRRPISPSQPGTVN
jgi:hypothetical protein